MPSQSISCCCGSGSSSSGGCIDKPAGYTATWPGIEDGTCNCQQLANGLDHPWDDDKEAFFYEQSLDTPCMYQGWITCNDNNYISYFIGGDGTSLASYGSEIGRDCCWEDEIELTLENNYFNDECESIPTTVTLTAYY
ncbi:MAG: hypothetical protein COA78_24720 [Blastopirellula sp.]|nr:MAG: hypothetical protein COA78_24720 [Blastopirellula sp.]